MPETGSHSEGKFQQSLWLSNSEDTPIVLCVEPWENELTISKGSNYLVVFEGPEGQCPAIEWSKNRVTVYGWSGSVASVFLDGQLVLSCAIKVPEVPTPFGSPSNPS